MNYTRNAPIIGEADEEQTIKRWLRWMRQVNHKVRKTVQPPSAADARKANIVANHSISTSTTVEKKTIGDSKILQVN